MQQSIILSQELNSFVFASNDDIKTTSLLVAEKFGKRHDDVLKKIKSLECSADFHLRNFAETFTDRVNPKGGQPIKSPAYEMTKDGFMFLVMGFTGKAAAQIKEAYINAFNLMHAKLFPKRNALVKLPASPYVTANEKLQLQKMISARVKRTNESHSMAWRYLFDAYRVNKMEFLPTGKLDEMCAYMGERTPRQDEMVLIKKRELDELKSLPLQQEAILPKGSIIINEERYKQLFDEKVMFDIDRVKYLMKKDNKALIPMERIDRVVEHLQYQDDRISGMLGIIKGMRESTSIIKDALKISKQLV